MDNKFLQLAEKTIMDVLREVQPELLEAYGKIDHVTKHDKSVVTQLDKTIEQRLREAIAPLDSGIGILGEEFGQEGNANTYWLIDPIDGTEQFIRGLPGCKNLLGLVVDGKPVWALMYMFAKDELWLARKDQGTFCNGLKIEMRHRPLERCWLEMSVNLFKPENVQKVLNVRKNIAGFSIRMGVDSVASGKIDGILALDASGGPWDYLPRYTLFTEAGAKMANLGKDDYDFTDKNFLVAHERNFDQLMQFVS